MAIVLGSVIAALGLLSIIYGTVMAFGAHGSMFFVIWFIIGAFLIVDVILRVRKVQLPSTPVLAVRAIAAILLILFIFCEACIMSQFHAKAPQGADYMIVAGALVYSYGPSPVLKYRLDAAASYLKENPSTICIVTGGKGTNEVRPEAEVMAEYLVSKGIAGERILLEPLSSTTTENMQNASALFDAKNRSVVIVTSNFHLFRAMRIAKKQGIPNVTGIAADSTPLYLPNNLLREFCGMGKDFLFGNM